MLKNIFLYGNLREKYGEKLCLDVNSVGEALRAIDANRPGFLIDLKQNQKYEVVRGESLTKGEHLECYDQLIMHYGKGDFHIAPATEGSLEPFTIFLIVMVLLMAVAFVLMSPAAIDDYGDREDPNERRSFHFGGPTNTTEQGGVLPLVYGRMIVGSTVVSAGINVESI